MSSQNPHRQNFTDLFYISARGKEARKDRKTKKTTKATLGDERKKTKEKMTVGVRMTEGGAARPECVKRENVRPGYVLL